MQQHKRGGLGVGQRSQLQKNVKVTCMRLFFIETALKVNNELMKFLQDKLKVHWNLEGKHVRLISESTIYFEIIDLKWKEPLHLQVCG